MKVLLWWMGVLLGFGFLALPGCTYRRIATEDFTHHRLNVARRSYDHLTYRGGACEEPTIEIREWDQKMSVPFALQGLLLGAATGNIPAAAVGALGGAVADVLTDEDQEEMPCLEDCHDPNATTESSKAEERRSPD